MTSFHNIGLRERDGQTDRDRRDRDRQEREGEREGGREGERRRTEVNEGAGAEGIYAAG